MEEPTRPADQVISDEQLRAELEKDPYLLHRLRADEERAHDAARKVSRDFGYLREAHAAIQKRRSEILGPKKANGGAPNPLAEARHIIDAIATYRAIEEGAAHLLKRQPEAPAIEVTP